MATYIPGKEDRQDTLGTGELFALTGTVICAILSVSILVYRLFKAGY